MQKIARMTTALITLLLLTGCAGKWEKAGAGPHEFEATDAACRSRAAMRFPPLVRDVVTRNGYHTPITTSCNDSGHSFSCTAGGGDYVPPQVITVDDNESPRSQDIRACLLENGWHQGHN
jgi:hypothetical protein